MNYNYMPSSVKPSYDTVFRHFCTLVANAGHSVAMLSDLDAARKAIASRADWLRGKQRRKWSQKREQEITELLDSYDRIISRMIDKGWR